jgi:dsDNA-specific endonuclease/ATPase MutS2
VREAITQSGLSGNICTEAIPVTLHEQEADRLLKKQQATQFTSIAETIRKQAHAVMRIPALLGDLERALLIYDFCTGVGLYTAQTSGFPSVGNQYKLLEGKNMFLSSPQPITFLLDQGTKASLLTGANSGGKTTLLEHCAQIVSLHQLGLPVKGIVELPLFTDVYYFAKNKGSMNKGAFETLLTQLSSIVPGERTLILADEIEAVTEPGVAGLLICGTVAYFVQQGCFIIIATHLGQDIQHYIPVGSRLDGIEAKGLNEHFELIIDHSPVLGRLAHSTPELIIERMAKTNAHPYFAFVHSYLRTHTQQ